MNRLKTTTFAALGIGAAVGLGSLVVSPGDFYITRQGRTKKQIPRPTTPDSFSDEVWAYRQYGSFMGEDFPMCGGYCPGSMTPEELKRDTERFKKLKARIIAEAKRQEAQEATCPRDRKVIL